MSFLVHNEKNKEGMVKIIFCSSLVRDRARERGEYAVGGKGVNTGSLGRVLRQFYLSIIPAPALTFCH